VAEIDRNHTEGYSGEKSSTTIVIHRPRSWVPAPTRPWKRIFWPAAEHGDRVAVLSAGDRHETQALAPWPRKKIQVRHLADLGHAKRARRRTASRRAGCRGRSLYAILATTARHRRQRAGGRCPREMSSSVRPR
jgi:hypothetical protein